MEQKMTPAEAWEGFVGSQTPAEFVQISREMGTTDIDQMCEEYVAEVPRMFGADTIVPEGLADLLARYIRQTVPDAE